MRLISRGLLLAGLGLVVGHAYAASPGHVDTITCTYPGGNTVKQNVYAFSLDTNANDGTYLKAYFSDSMLETFFIAEATGQTFSSCTFDKLPVVLQTVKIVDVDTVGVGAHLASVQADSMSLAYTEVTFSAARTTVLSNSATMTTPLSSKEDQAQALAAFKAKGISILK